MAEAAHGWRCSVCRVSSATWSRIAGKRCRPGAAAVCAFARAAGPAAELGAPDLGHELWRSDNTIWCNRCGQQATEAVVGLK